MREVVPSPRASGKALGLRSRHATCTLGGLQEKEAGEMGFRAPGLALFYETPFPVGNAHDSEGFHVIHTSPGTLLEIWGLPGSGGRGGKERL